MDGPSQRALWLATIDQMRTVPGADAAELTLIRSYITDGITLPFDSIPPAIEFPNTPNITEHFAVVQARLEEYRQFGAIRELPPGEALAHGIQPLLAVVKEDGSRKARIVIDLSRNLNGFLTTDSFHYSSVEDAVALSTPDGWYGKMDLSNCFLSFPLHPGVIPYFTFRLDERLYQFTRMPFGLSVAPRICTQLLSVVAFALRKEMERFVRYLDDFLFIAPSRKLIQEALVTAHRVFTAFGLVVNQSKTEGPVQVITFLGIEINSLQQTLACSAARIAELRSLLADASAARVVRRKHLESLIGKLSFAAQVLPGARPFMRRLLDTLGRGRRK